MLTILLSDALVGKIFLHFHLPHSLIIWLTKAQGYHGQGKKYTLDGSVCIPYSETTCQRYVHSSLKNSQLGAFSFRLFILSLIKTATNLTILSSNVEKTTMSSRYMRQSFPSVFERLLVHYKDQKASS